MIAAVLLATAATLGTVRLTETSITETGTVDGSDFKMKTKGYGLGYIHPSGFGGHLTSLSSTGAGGDGTGLTYADLRHVYLDGSYTEGFLEDHLLVTGGFGIGIAGKARFQTAGGAGQETSDFASKDWFIGPGFSVGWFEAYWIHRRNFIEYKKDGGGEITMSSRHYQLGLGARF